MSTSPISNLDDDSLFTIFDIITRQWPTTLEARPLNNIRAASQVCSRWRGLCISSPWIWARVIDLNYSRRYPGPNRAKRGKWLGEVLKRSGSAPLWICGESVLRSGIVDADLFDTYSFFVRLLGEWERIERLVVRIDTSSGNEAIPEEIQTRFLSRAPLLKLFHVTSSGNDSILLTDTLPPGSALFADYAPSLQSIRARNIAFKPNSPWLSNILNIDPVPSNFVMEDIYVLLNHTPILKSITFDTQEQGFERGISYPKPPLPNLSSITMYTTLAIGARILDHLDNLSHRKLSNLLIRIFDDTITQVDRSILSRWKEILPSFISNIFTWNPPTYLSLRFSPKSFTLGQVIDNERYLGQRLEIDVKTSFRDLRDWDALTSCFLDIFGLSCNSSVFNNVTTLGLNFGAALSPAIVAQLYSVLTGFQHIQSITTDEPSCQILWEISFPDEAGGRHRHILFPKLHTLQLGSRNIKDEKRYNALPRFLIKRKDLGFPLAKLDLTECKQSEYGQDLGVLEQVAGLEVVWSTSRRWRGTPTGWDPAKINTYICGTGNPECLNGLISKALD